MTADSFIAHMAVLVQAAEKVLAFAPNEKWAVGKLVHRRSARGGRQPCPVFVVREKEHEFI
jgi:hypothetical protein